MSKSWHPGGPQPGLSAPGRSGEPPGLQGARCLL